MNLTLYFFFIKILLLENVNINILNEKILITFNF